MRRRGFLTGSLALPFIGSARAQAPTTVSLAVLAPSSLFWVHAVAEARGFYAARGLQVRELRAADSPALIQAVATGSAQAGAGLGDLALRAIDRNAPLVIAGALLSKAVLRLYGSRGITSAAQLAGQRVTAGAVRGGTANLLRFQLQRLNVDISGLQMVSIPNSRDRIVAMGNGQVQGALLSPPFDALAERDGAVLLDTHRDDYVQTPLIYHRPWAEANRPTARGLAQAMRQGAAWLVDPGNRAEAVDILARYTNIDRDLCDASYAFIIRDQGAVRADLEMSADGLSNLYAIDAAVGGEPPNRDFRLDRYFDPSYLRG